MPGVFQTNSRTYSCGRWCFVSRTLGGTVSGSYIQQHYRPGSALARSEYHEHSAKNSWRGTSQTSTNSQIAKGRGREALENILRQGSQGISLKVSGGGRHGNMRKQRHFAGKQIQTFRFCSGGGNASGNPRAWPIGRAKACVYTSRSRPFKTASFASCRIAYATYCLYCR